VVVEEEPLNGSEMKEERMRGQRDWKKGGGFTTGEEARVL
jgi:hypothetical protein